MRKRKPKLKGIEPDPRYNDPNVTRFVNNLMYSGKKSRAYGLFYEAMDIIDERTAEGGDETGKKARDSGMRPVEAGSTRVGGATVEVGAEGDRQRRRGERGEEGGGRVGGRGRGASYGRVK